MSNRTSSKIEPYPRLSSAPDHGGDLVQASIQHNIPIADWLDLSTGISPNSYPIPSIPDDCFHRLPNAYSHQLVEAAQSYYQTENVLPAAGSQAFIELLPTLHTPCSVALPDVGYREHAWNWQRRGHELVWYDGFNPASLKRALSNRSVSCAVLINPNNPTAATMTHRDIISCQETLAERNGWLIIDGAFQDAWGTGQDPSFPSYSGLPGVIELRSLGKFFGLAGIRVGFALASEQTISDLAPHIGVWSVSSVSEFIAATALNDKNWQVHSRAQLQMDSTWMHDALNLYYPNTDIFKTSFFVSVLLPLETALSERQRLASKGVWTRLWPLNQTGQALLRFGLISELNQTARALFTELHKPPHTTAQSS